MDVARANARGLKATHMHRSESLHNRPVHGKSQKERGKRQRLKKTRTLRNTQDESKHSLKKKFLYKFAHIER